MQIHNQAVIGGRPPRRPKRPKPAKPVRQEVVIRRASGAYRLGRWLLNHLTFGLWGFFVGRRE